MSLSSASSAIFRRSYLYYDDSSSFSSLDNNDTTASRRFSSLRNSRPSSSSSRSSNYEATPRSRTSSDESRKRRDSTDSQLSKRMSFMDLREDAPSRFFGSLKGRMQRKRSAPLLGRSNRAAPSNEPFASKTASSSRTTISRAPFLATRDDNDIPSNVDAILLPDFRDERKSTIVPEEVVDGVGYGVRASRLSTVPECEAVDDVDVSKPEYRALPCRKRDGMVLHSYMRSEAPYMRSYNRVDLQNDAYFHHLLRRLNTTGHPSFHEYLSPPEDVLDLGCGQGSWVLEAANSWLGAKVVGYDLVNLVGDSDMLNSNVTWKRGNFIAYRLPFEPGSFDLVRMANLTEAIPLHRWEHILIEVRRVLKPAGRIEIIDDEIMFPYPHLTRQASSFSRGSGSQNARNSWGSNESKLSNDIAEDVGQPINNSFLDLDAFLDRRSIGSAPSLCREDSPSEESTDCLQTPVDDIGSMSTLLQSKIHYVTQDVSLPSTPLCQEMEAIYKRMLENVYDINAHPADLLESLLRKVFGPAGKVNVLKDFRLSLLNPEMHDLVVTSKNADPNLDSSKRSRKLFKTDRDGRKIDKNKEILDKVIISQSKNKALRVLGAAGDSSPARNPISTNASDDSEVYDEQMLGTRTHASSAVSSLAFPVPTSSRPSTSSSAVSRPKGNNSPTGLFVYPDQFLEATPFELERYLCKHIDTLLGCKAALVDYVLSLRDEDGECIVQEDEWCDMLWEYERSKRDRFGLPNSGGILDEDEDEGATNLLREPVQHPRSVIQPVAAAISTRACPQSSPSDCSDTSQPSTLVRRIRVFEAYRIKPSLPS